MLSNILLANLMEKKLIELGEEESQPYTFRIFTEIADLKKGSHNRDVRGLLRATSAGDVVPLSGFSNSVVPFEINFIVSSFAFDNTHVIRVGEIIKRFIRSINGEKFPLDNGFVILTPGEPTFYNVETRPANGDSTLCSLTFDVNYFESAISSADRKWFLDGVELPYFSERVSDVRQGVTNNISGRNATQSLTLQQVKTWMFELPYDGANAACVQLQKDILDGDPDKTYELKFYDGVTYTEAEPFIKTVTLFNGSDTETIRSRVTSFVVAFAETDKAEETGIRYYMALIDTSFSPDTLNVRCFESQELQRAYYNDKIAQGAAFVPILAPNLQGLTITQQIYKDVHNYELMWLLQKNYAIIKIVDYNKPEDKPQYLYFWAKGNVGAKNMTLWDLRLDSIQTYLFNPDLEFNNCLIERAHLDRWADNGDGTVSFDNAPNSPLLNQDGVELPKRLVSRTLIYPKVDTGNTTELNNRINSTMWLIVCVSPDTIRAGITEEGVPIVKNLPDYIPKYFTGNYVMHTVGGLNTNQIILAAPLLGSFRIELEDASGAPTGEWMHWGAKDLIVAISDDNLSPFITSIKISPVCPLKVADHTNDYSYDSMSSTISITNQPNFNIFTRGTILLGGRTDGGLCALTEQSNKSAFFEFELPYKTTFQKSEVVGKNTDPIFNPKLLSQLYTELNLVDYAGNSFTYDIQKINNQQARFLVTELISDGITKGYIRLQDSDNSVYNNGTESNYTGLVYSNDTLLPLFVSSYANFNANNKNFAAIQQSLRDYNTQSLKLSQTMMWAQYATGAVQGIQGGAASGAASGGLAGAAMGAAQGLNDAMWGAASTGLNHAAMKARTGMQNNLSKKMEAFTLDNVKAAPGSLQNAQGNILFNAITDHNIDGKVNFYIELHRAFDADIRKIHETFNLFGFSYARIGNIKSFMRTRKYYNYIQAEIDIISGVPMNNDARADIKNRFAQGMRFWHSDNIQYELENYERRLEDFTPPDPPDPIEETITILYEGDVFDVTDIQMQEAPEPDPVYGGNIPPADPSEVQKLDYISIPLSGTMLNGVETDDIINISMEGYLFNDDATNIPATAHFIQDNILNIQLQLADAGNWYRFHNQTSASVAYRKSKVFITYTTSQ